MKIKTSSLVFRLWSWAAKWGNGAEGYRQELSRANVCRMFWTTLGTGLLYGLWYTMGLPVLSLWLGTVYLVWACIAFLVGYVPRVGPMHAGKLFFVARSDVSLTCGRLLGISLGRFRLYPYHAVIAYFALRITSYLAVTPLKIVQHEHAPLISFLVFMAVGIAIIAMILGLVMLGTSDVAAAYLRAKKDRVCPRVTFVDDAGVLPKDESET